MLLEFISLRALKMQRALVCAIVFLYLFSVLLHNTVFRPLASG